MCFHRSLWPILLVWSAMAGCSSPMGPRFGGTPQAKSIAVVGDRPLPASTGEPGGQVAADVAEPEPNRNPRTRISGRVVDGLGEPAPNVMVRLADGGTKGGRDIRSTTDRSGAFTLNGLRPGSTYSIIAESEDAQGPLTGRVQARTADTGVEIGLLPEGSPRAGAASKAPGRPSRAKQISTRPVDEPPAEEEGRPLVNREDLPAADPEAGEIDPGPPPPAPAGRPQLSAPQSSAGWRNRGSAQASPPRSQDGDIVASSMDGPTRRGSAPAGPEEPDDEGPNPLPPAIPTRSSPVPGPDPGPDSPRRPSASSKKPRPKLPPAPEPGEIYLGPEASRGEPSGPEGTSTRERSAESVAATMPPMSDLGPGPGPDPGDPPAVVAALPGMPPMSDDPATSAGPSPPTASPPMASAENIDASPLPASRPVFSSPPRPTSALVAPEDYNPFALVGAHPPADRRAVDPTSSTPPAGQSAPAGGAPPPELSPTVAETPRRTWGDLATSDRSPIAVEPSRAPIAVAKPESFARRLRGAVENRDPSVALCSYDARQQRIKDFRLPDLEGKPVHFRDLDADYVLLDFWGTWCGPCLDSIPHLILLQKKYGPGRLRVVGIACEEVAVEQRKAKVEEVSRSLGINYAILLSSMDGKPCPVQSTLQVQALPTMILVDRRGQVVWRDTGATPPTLDRLDRVIASTMGRGETARR